MSQYSLHVVDDNEMLARFIFSPMHLDKKGNIKPSIFSHVFNVGCSIQRDTIATSEEIIDFAKIFLNGDDSRKWKGVLLAKCSDIKTIKASKHSVPLLKKEGLGEVLLNNPPQSPLFKGGGE